MFLHSLKNFSIYNKPKENKGFSPLQVSFGRNYKPSWADFRNILTQKVPYCIYTGIRVYPDKELKRLENFLIKKSGKEIAPVVENFIGNIPEIHNSHKFLKELHRLAVNNPEVSGKKLLMDTANKILASPKGYSNGFLEKMQTHQTSNSHKSLIKYVLYPMRATIDHIVPKATGGIDNPTDMAVCSAWVNELKGAQSFKTFAKTVPNIFDNIANYIKKSQGIVIPETNQPYSNTIQRLFEMIA